MMRYRDTRGAVYTVGSIYTGCWTIYRTERGQTRPVRGAVLANERAVVQRDLDAAARRQAWQTVEEPAPPRCIFCRGRKVIPHGDRDWYCHECHAVFAIEDDGDVGYGRPERVAARREKKARRR